MGNRRKNDLLGEEEPLTKKEILRRSREKRRKNNPKYQEESRHRQVKRMEKEKKKNPLNIEDVYRGVTVSWLMNAFRMDRPKVKRRVAELTPIKYGHGNAPIYDFVQAASCLVEPKVDIAKFIKNASSEDLPSHLQTAYWDAKLKRQKYLERAGDLWRTEDVISVYSEAFKTIKSAVQLWTYTLEETAGLSNEQRDVVDRLTRELLDELYKGLTAIKDRQETPSTLSEEENVPDS